MMQRRTKTVMVRVRVNVEAKTAEKMVAIREATAGKGFGHLERFKARERRRGRRNQEMVSC